MAKEVNRLTARQVDALSKKGRYHDGNGLYLQIMSDGGSKSWLFRYQLDGKARQMGLGPLKAFSLAEARAKTKECHQMIFEGLDPIEERRKQKAARKASAVRVHTFEDCAKAFIKAKSSEWSNIKHSKQWTSTLETYAYPILGALDVRDIDVGLVMQVVEPIWNEKRETATRVRGRIEQILDYAIAHEYRPEPNPARWKGKLENLLASKQTAKVKHHSALPYDDMADFMLSLAQKDGIAPKALAFLVYTAARTNEVIGATWDEIDLEARTWTIPAERMKAKQGHKVPLTAPATAILEEMQALRQSDYVFPGWKKGTKLSNMAMLKMLKKQMGRDDLTVHGFRSTFKDWASERTNYPNEVSEMALAHKQKNKVEAAYRRGDLFEKRTRLMDEWARFCTTPASTGKVVAMKGAK